MYNQYIVKNVQHFNTVTIAHNDIVKLSANPSISEIRSLLSEINVKVPLNIKKREVADGIVITHDSHQIIKLQHIDIAKKKHSFTEIDKCGIVAKFNKNIDKIEVFKKGEYLSTVKYFDDPSDVERYMVKMSVPISTP